MLVTAVVSQVWLYLARNSNLRSSRQSPPWPSFQLIFTPMEALSKLYEPFGQRHDALPSVS